MYFANAFGKFFGEVFRITDAMKICIAISYGFWLLYVVFILVFIFFFPGLH